MSSSSSWPSSALPSPPLSSPVRLAFSLLSLFTPANLGFETHRMLLRPNDQHPPHHPGVHPRCVFLLFSLPRLAKVADSEGIETGHIHAFWLIYKNAQAEERYGANNYRYCGNGEYGESSSLFLPCSALARKLTSVVGLQLLSDMRTTPTFLTRPMRLLTMVPPELIRRTHTRCYPPFPFLGSLSSCPFPFVCN